MHIKQVPFSRTGYFSTLICDYINQKPELEALYNRFPSVENFKGQIEEKHKYDFTSQHGRDVLVRLLKQQYSGIDTSEATASHIESLKSNNTFTIPPGNNSNLLTGPWYFSYKLFRPSN